jgi:LuxR family maltose regulon positive regulatory protein
LPGRQNTHRFIDSLSGSHTIIQEYLVEEVLNKQPEALQNFLLQTSVLARLNGSLCDAVTGQSESQVRLFELERANLFVQPLDGQGQWYRCHLLFAGALRAQLQMRHPILIPCLHRRAAAWYEARGQAADAIEHTLAIPDDERAAHLIGQQARTTLMAGQSSTLLQWLNALPDQTIRKHQELALCHAWALLFTGQLHAALTRLHAVSASPDLLPFSPPHALSSQRIHDETEALRRILQAFHGGASASIQRVPEQELTGDPEGDEHWHSLVALSLGIQAADVGQEHLARRWLAQALRLGTRHNQLLVSVLALCQLAEVHMVQGQLRRAAAYYRQALLLATDPYGHPLPIEGLAHEELGLLLREWNDLDGAAQHLLTGIQLCTHWAEAWTLDGYLALARVYAAQGRQEAAQSAIKEAERIAPLLASEVFLGHVAMTQVRLDLLQGHLQTAARWARAAQVSSDGEIGAEDEPMYLLLARVLLAQGEPDRAANLMARLLPGVEAAGRAGRLIELLALQALAFHAQHAIPQALAAIEQALMLAAPEGFARLFLELGAPMAALLQKARANNILPDYTGQILAAFHMAASRLIVFSTNATHNGKVNGTAPPTPLTSREREVLRLLAAGASNRAIAEELVITVGTVKKHLHTIFYKLQAESRTQAIAAAMAFNLV